MASSYTTNSGIEKPAQGDQTGEWGTTINTNMDIIDRSINGVLALSLSGTTTTLTTTDGTLTDGMYKVLVLGGSPSGTNTITVAPNDADKLYFVVNSSGQTATFTQGSGANVNVLNGDTAVIYCDGAGSGAAVADFTKDLGMSSVNIDGGTIDGAVIGGASAAAGTFTTLDTSGAVNLNLTTDSSSSTSGALIVDGGVGIAKKLYVGTDADIDGTLEADAMTLNGTAITTTATLSTGISNTNVPVFTTGVADDDFLRVAGTSIEGRSAAEVLSDIGASAAAGSGSIVTTGALDSGSITSGFGTINNGSSAITTTGLISGGSLDIDDVVINGSTIGHTDDTDLITVANGVATVAGEVSMTTLDIGGTNVTSTAAEINLIDGGTARGTTAVASGDGILINDAGTMRMTNVDTVSTYFASHSVGGGNIVTTGALNSGSITSGFGAIDNGSSAITTTGVITGGTVEATTDTAAGDNAAIGYTSAEGLILTGQGSTSDVTIKNDADATVLSIPTGSTGVNITSAIDVVGSNFANVEFTGASVNGSGVYTGLDSGGGYVVNVRDSGYIGFSTTNAERMRVDSAGKVGIGTTAPNGQLQVHSAALGTTATNTVDILQLHSPDTSNNTVYKFLNYRHSNGSSHSESELRWQRRVDVSNHGYIGLRDGSITFGYGDNTERVRLLSNGDTCFASTAIGFANQRAIQIQTSSTGLIAIQHLNTEGNGAAYLWFTHNGNPIGSIVQNGTSGITYNTSSDYRLKENIDYTWDATTRLKQLKPARFNFISDEERGTVDGFLAHEVSSVVPEAVTGEKDAVDNDGKPIHQGIDQSKLVPLLVKTIQELEARITALEAG